ncbi:thioredoxin family protein [Aureliella helgolandensis]|uniref:Thiol:disulfide interchange protein n=1 Tax=Aureliella helgolandensis TaxID=2527968 RepID=A0A518G876_9BACT|nr:thioredoxin family protein [Aureliella helgolandensis]QDV24789.1 thiol:disulfide interchange protein precursor [Aureliella helgolandensis]
MQETLSATESKAQSSPGIALWLWRWFWRVTLVVSLSYAWYCFYVPKNDIAWAEEYPAAKLSAAQSGKPMVLFFTGKWCVPCRIMKRTVWADEQVESVVNAGFTPILIDVGEPGPSSVALERYQVYETPTTIIADAQGNVLEQVGGAMTKAEFLALLGKPHISKLAP